MPAMLQVAKAPDPSRTDSGGSADSAIDYFHKIVHAGCIPLLCVQIPGLTILRSNGR